MAGPVELIPGTALPMYSPATARQPEGRGDVIISPERHPPALVPGDPTPDQITEAQRQLYDLAIRSFDKRKTLEKEEYFTVGDQTDPITGNCVIPLFEVPQGRRGVITQLIVDAPSSASITPAAPFANASSWAFISIAPASSGPADNTALRFGLAAFAPTSAAGPIIPGQWTFNDDEAPIAWGGEQFYFVLIGGSQAALTNLQIQVTPRINVYSHVG